MLGGYRGPLQRGLQNPPEAHKAQLHCCRADMVHFVHSAASLFERLAKPRKVCTKYFRALCSHIDSPYSSEEKATKVLANTLFKAEALHLDDREKTRGCLRRKEKLREKDMEGK